MSRIRDFGYMNHPRAYPKIKGVSMDGIQGVYNTLKLTAEFGVYILGEVMFLKLDSWRSSRVDPKKVKITYLNDSLKKIFWYSIFLFVMGLLYQ